MFRLFTVHAKSCMCCVCICGMYIVVAVYIIIYKMQTCCIQARHSTYNCVRTAWTCSGVEQIKGKI